MRKFVKFFYKREIKEEEEEGNLRYFLELAEKYDLPHLKEEVEELAIRKLTVENMVDMLKVKEGLADLEKLEKSQRMKIVSICIV